MSRPTGASSCVQYQQYQRALGVLPCVQCLRCPTVKRNVVDGMLEKDVFKASHLLPVQHPACSNHVSDDGAVVESGMDDPA